MPGLSSQFVLIPFSPHLQLFFATKTKRRGTWDVKIRCQPVENEKEEVSRRVGVLSKMLSWGCVVKGLHKNVQAVVGGWRLVYI